MEWSEARKRKACTETLLLYEALPANEKKLIPLWLKESLERYYDRDIARQTSAERVIKNMDDYTAAVVQILLYFGYECTEKELNSVVTRSNRNFLIDLMSYQYDKED